MKKLLFLLLALSAFNAHSQIVVDNTPPLLICPNNPNVPLNNDCQYIIPNFLNSINLNDNCDPSPSFTQSVTIGDTLTGLGFQQSIILTTADSYGNTRIGSNLILPESTLLDLTAPFIHERCACLYMVVELTLSAGGDSAYVARSTERVDSRVTGISIL